MRCLVLHNPASSRGQGLHRSRRIESALRRQSIDPEMVETGGRGDAARLVARHGSAFETIVVAGGHGTIHEALQALDLDRHVLGVLPSGTGNDFAWMNGIPADLERAAAVLRAGHVRRVDIGLWGERRFHNSIGIGFEGRVNYESHRIRWLRGPAVYLAAVARTLAHRRAQPVSIDWDTGAWSGDVFMASVCIGQRVGGAFRLAPAARNDDGKFEVCIAGRLGLWRILTLLPRTFRGTHVGAAGVQMVGTSSLRLTAPEGVPVHVDGEFVGLDVRELQLSILPRALRLLAPAASR